MSDDTEKAIAMLPIKLEGEVERGFGRGSRLLGFPTANIPPERYNRLLEQLPLGVYYGWAVVTPPTTPTNPFPAPDMLKPEDLNRALQPPNGFTKHMMAMSIGLNPSFHNEHKTIEVHIIHKFESDFYGAHLTIDVIGYLRPMIPFKSIVELKQAITQDCERAKEELTRKQH